MDIAPEKQAERLKQARLMRGFKTARAACEAFGWNYTTYSQQERGINGLGRSADRYARAFHVPAGWLLTGEGEPEVKSGSYMVPIISWVSAGKLEEPGNIEDMENARHINAGELPPGGKWVAMEVQGDSMDRISPPGSIIIINLNERELVSGGHYVIRQEDGATTYKRYKSDPDRLEPVSTNTAHETLFPKAPVTVLGRVRKTIIDM